MKKVNERRYLYGVSLFKMALLLVVFITNLTFVNAQQAQPLAKVQTQLQKDNPAEAKQLKHLLKDIVPTAYINGEGVQLSKSAQSTSAKVIDVSSQFLQQVYKPNEQLNSVVLLKIRLQNKADLKQVVNLDKLRDLSNLKYIHLLFEVATDEKATISQIIKGSNEQIVITYKTSIPK